MPLWIVGLVGIGITALLLRGIISVVRTSSLQLERKLDTLSDSMGRLVGTLVGLNANLEDEMDKMSDQIAAIERLLKPVSYLAESQLEGLGAEHIAEVSKRADHLVDAVDGVKRALARREIQAAHENQEWKKIDDEVQAKLRLEKNLIKAQRRIGQSQCETEESKQ